MTQNWIRFGLAALASCPLTRFRQFVDRCVFASKCHLILEHRLGESPQHPQSLLCPGSAVPVLIPRLATVQYARGHGDSGSMRAVTGLLRPRGARAVKQFD